MTPRVGRKATKVYYYYYLPSNILPEFSVLEFMRLQAVLDGRNQSCETQDWPARCTKYLIDGFFFIFSL